MEHLLGLLKIRVDRGINLAKRDVTSSDPYVVIRSGKQKLKTRVVKKNVNPEWNDDLTLTVSHPELPIKLEVYDYDMFSLDDKMGDAEFDIKPFVDAVNMRLHGLPDGTIITKVLPDRKNCLSGESKIVFTNQGVVQTICLRLRNVESGEIELQLHWVDIPAGSKLSRGL